ncbi:hypothetical protein GW17_00025959 [Ensete ventricosum]|nr:hypothetical protein GW17_00025959 [Ensete ventricosum]
MEITREVKLHGEESRNHDQHMQIDPNYPIMKLRDKVDHIGFELGSHQFFELASFAVHGGRFFATHRIQRIDIVINEQGKGSRIWDFGARLPGNCRVSEEANEKGKAKATTTRSRENNPYERRRR